MAKENKSPVSKKVEDIKPEDKRKALETALTQIKKQFGEGAVMRLGQNNGMHVDAISTGSLSLDLALGNEKYDMYKPAALIIPSNELIGDTGITSWDNACALENIFLAAHSMGLGTVWINQLSDTCDVPEVRAVLTEFGVPENHKVFGIAAIGYAAAETPVKEKKFPVTYVE